MIIEDLSYFECFDCGHSFYCIDLPFGINDPIYCPYCGIDFEEVHEVDNEDYDM